MSPSYLLDTNICIYLLKGKHNIAQRLDSLNARYCISEITLAELYYGASKSQRKDEQIKDVHVIASLFEIIPIRHSLELYGDNKCALEQSGKRIDDFDLLIGSTAVQHNMILVTENVKHLSRIPNITIENWVAEQESQ